MAPATFDRAGSRSRVHTQPGRDAEAVAALKALVACPTASIGTLEKHDVRTIAHGFPDPITDSVYHCGYHHEDSFGAASYLIVRPEGNILVDSPRFAAPLVNRIEAMGGVALMFLTHRDDVADHRKFADHFGCTRVLHHGDVTSATQDVEMQPDAEDPIQLAGDLTMIPVPGHTRGSACLLYGKTFLFSGDHLAWSVSMQRVSAFQGVCWYDWEKQTESMRRLSEYDFNHLLPGHGHPCRLTRAAMRQSMLDCVAWMESRA